MPPPRLWSLFYIQEGINDTKHPGQNDCVLICSAARESLDAVDRSEAIEREKRSQLRGEDADMHEAGNEARRLPPSLLILPFNSLMEVYGSHKSFPAEGACRLFSTDAFPSWAFRCPPFHPDT